MKKTLKIRKKNQIAGFQCTNAPKDGLYKEKTKTKQNEINWR